MTSECWLASVGCPGSCDGPMDRAHLIPKQRIRRELRGDLTREQLDEAIWHPSVWRWACRFHHGQLDNGAFHLDRSLLPASVAEFARIWGMEWSIDSDYGAAPVG
jgi:hypothetical protein